MNTTNTHPNTHPNTSIAAADVVAPPCPSTTVPAAAGVAAGAACPVSTNDPVTAACAAAMSAWRS